jgi:UrcA family protein
MKKMKCLMLLTVIMGLVTVPALARDALFGNEGVLHEKVHYSDLNLADAKGVTTLYHRITAAAEHVCPGYNDGGGRQPLSTVALAKECRAQAVNAAVAKIGNAALQRYYEATPLGARHAQMTASNMTAPKIEVSLD